MENTKNTPTTLNANELAVLKSAAESNEGNGRDFGFTDEVKVEGLSKHQIAGYLGDLTNKGLLVTYDHEVNGKAVPGVDLTAEGWAIIDNDLGLKTEIEDVLESMPEYEDNDVTETVTCQVRRDFNSETLRYDRVFEVEVEVSYPSTMTERQISKLKHCIQRWADQHISREGEYEVKKLEVNKFPKSPLVFVHAEFGMVNDENTAASVFCRNCHFVKIGKRGGLDAMNQNGTWIDGMHAIHTQSKY